MPESNVAVTNNGQLLKRIIRAGIVEDVHVIAQRQRLFDQLERSGYPADYFIGRNVVATFVDALHDTRLVERWVTQVNEHQNDFITEGFGLCGKVNFRRMREHGFKTKTAALPQQLQAQVFRQFGGVIAVCFRRLRIQQLGQDIRVDKRQTCGRQPGTVESTFARTVASGQQPQLFFLAQSAGSIISMNSPP